MKNDIRHKELIRGKILFYLALVYPHSTSLPLLQGELDIFGYPVPMDDLNFHVAYLSEKGFVATELARRTEPPLPDPAGDHYGEGD